MTAATSGNIALTTTPAYCTETQWRDKTGISTTTESAAQFVIDLREAHELVRRNCMFLVRERLISINTDLKAFLPKRWITDGNMDGSVDSSDIVIHELDDDGHTLNSVDNSTYISEINSFNNYILFLSASSALTNQLYVTYYACSKPFDEITSDELKRLVMAQTTVLVIERLRLNWGLTGSTGWSVPGVTVNKDVQSYKQLYNEAKKELEKYKTFIRPFEGRAVRLNRGDQLDAYDPNIAYSSQRLFNRRIWR